MDTAGFFHRVLPEGGKWFTVTWPSRDKKLGWPSRSFEIKDGPTSAIGLISWAVSNKIDIYHAVASFAIGDPRSNRKGEPYTIAPRTQGNAQLLRVLFIDADVAREGDGKDPARVFPDRRAALRWMKTFCPSVGLPEPTIIVDSGHGYHWYWCLEQALTAAEWVPLAGALKAAAVAHNFVGDTGFITDTARVLRPPGSVNMKSGQPVRVSVVTAAEQDIPNAAILQALKPWFGQAQSAQTGTQGRRGSTTATVITLGPRPSHLPPTGQANTAMNDAAMQGMPAKRWLFTAVAAKCEQVKRSLSTGGEGEPYQLWTAHHTLAAHCGDGREYIHAFSDRDPRYDREANEHKFEQTLDEVTRKDLGAPRCTTYQSYRAGVCETCAFFGKLNSPVALGAENGDLPHRYQRRQVGNEFCIEWQNAEGDWMTVVMGDVYAPRLDHLEHGGYMLSFTHELGGVRSPVSVNGGDMGSPALLALLEKQNISVDKHTAPRAGVFIVAWINQLRAQRVERNDALRPWGWNFSQAGDRLGLAIAGIHYRRDGTEEPIAGGDPKIRANYTPMGSYDKWRQVTRLFETKRPDLQLIIACSFASPLISLCSDVRGMSLNLWSNESGIGKTTALAMGVSVWGDHTIMQSMTDTPNAVMRSLSEPRVLVRYWDELRIKKHWEEGWVELIHTIPQGKERARMQADTTLREVGEWEAMLVFTANRPCSNYLLASAPGTDAGLYRLLEVPLYKEKQAYQPHAGKLIKLLDTNYGHAGRIYARHLATHPEEVASLVRTTAEKVAATLDARQEERFYVTAIACLIVGAQLATKLDLFNFDLPGMVAVLKRAFIDGREHVETHTFVGLQGGFALEQLVGEYYAESADWRLRTQGFNAAGGNHRVTVIAQPRGNEVRVHYSEEKPQALRVARRHFERWLSIRNLPASVIIDQLKRDFSAVESSRVLGGGTNYATVGRIPVIEIPVTTNMLDGFDIDDDATLTQLSQETTSEEARP